MKKSYKIAVLPGDGIGVEIIPQGVRALKAAAAKFGIEIETEEGLIGGAAYDATGSPFPEETAKLCAAADGVFLGAVGGPKWDHVQPSSNRPEGGLFAVRKLLGAYANLRPVFVFDTLAENAALKTERVAGGFDIIFVRELTSGIYFGKPKERREVNGEIVAVDTCAYSVSEIKRVAHKAFKQAMMRKKLVHSVDKANAMETSRLWRETVAEVAKEYPEVTLINMYSDNCAMQLLRDPKQFDVILTDNLFGDILSDEASMLSGSLGLLPSASLSDTHGGLYEPIHGSAPDIAGKGIANPLATIMCAGLILRNVCNCPKGDELVFGVVKSILDDGYRTIDIAKEGDTKILNCKEAGDLVVERINAATV